MASSVEAFLGLILVVRQEGGQPAVAYCYPDSIEDSGKILGVGSRELAKFALPSPWLSNKRFDFEMGQSVNERSRAYLRFVSFPCDTNVSSVSSSEIGYRVTSFSLLFAFDGDRLDESTSDVFWQAACVLSRGIIAEEGRCLFLSEEVSKLAQHRGSHSSRLTDLLETVYKELKCRERASCSLYINDALHVHISTIPSEDAPEPPSMHKAILLLADKDTLQTELPVDSASIVRRVVDAADPQKCLKDLMIDLGLPLSTLQRVSQHLAYWRKAEIVNPITVSTKLAIHPDFSGKVDKLAQSFSSGFCANPSLVEILSFFQPSLRLGDVKERISSKYQILGNRFWAMVIWLLEKQLLKFVEEFVFYSPSSISDKSMLAKQQAAQISMSFARDLPLSVRKRFSPPEMRAIYSKLGGDAVKTEIVLRLITESISEKSDIITAQSSICETALCTPEEFNKLLDHILAFEDSFLVKYECSS